MNNLSKKEQLFAEKLVLKEKKIVEEKLTNWGLSWNEEILDTLNQSSKEYGAHFGRIEWTGIKSHNATRDFKFYNNGIIEFNKIGNKKSSNSVSYYTSFNVLKSDFKIQLFQKKSDKPLENDDEIIFKIENDYFLTITINGIGKTINLYDGSDEIMTGNRDYYDSRIINDIVDEATEIIKVIKGEIPLPGLVERINYGISVLNTIKNKRTRKR